MLAMINEKQNKKDYNLQCDFTLVVKFESDCKDSLFFVWLNEHGVWLGPYLVASSPLLPAVVRERGWIISWEDLAKICSTLSHGHSY